MGSCTALLNRHLHSRGSHLERLCCGAAAARSPATIYQEVGSQYTRSKEGSRRSAHEAFETQASARNHQQQEASASGILDPASAELLRVHETSASRCFLAASGGVPETVSTASERVAAPAARSLSGLLTPCLSEEAHVLHPPGVLQQEQQVLLQQYKNDKDDFLPAQQQQQQHSVERPQGANVLGAFLKAETMADGAKICLQPDAEQSAAPLRIAGNVSRNPYTLSHVGMHAHPLSPSPPRQQETSSLSYHSAPQMPREQGELNAECVFSIAAVRAELPPYLDAASRTAGVVSTSDKQPVPVAGPGFAGDVTSRRRRVLRCRTHGADRGCAAREPSPRSKCSPVAASGTIMSPAPASGGTLAATVATSASIAEVQGVIGSSAANLIAARATSDSNGTRKDKGNSISVGAQRAAPAAAKPRRPRTPTATEHRALRIRARLQQVALLPRDPTEDDLRLTVRILCVTHWQDLITLLVEHRERHNRRGNQERMQPFLQRSARLQQSRRRRSPGGISGAASDASIAAADAVATATVALGLQDPADLSVLPVSALPLTPQHVATALLRTWQLLAVVPGPRTPVEARALASMVDWLARHAARLAPSPGTSLRELATIFYALVRLRHPLDKRFYLVLMNEARKRFSAQSGRSTYCHRGCSRSSSSSSLSGSHMGESEWGSGAAIGASASSSLPYNGQDMSQLLWAVANCGMKSIRGDWSTAYCSALLPVISELTPQGVSLVLHSLGRLRCAPSPDVLAALCSRLVQLTGYDDGLFPLRSIAASTAAQLEISPSHDGRLEANIWIGDGLDHGSVNDPSSWAWTKEQQHGNRFANGHRDRRPATIASPEDSALGRQLAWDDLTVLELYGNRQGSNDPPGRFSPSLRSPPQQQHVHQPGREWKSEAPSAPSSSHGVGGASSGESPHLQPACLPADVSMSLWALATLRLPPAGYCPQLMPAVERYSLSRLAAFPEQELSNLVWAMARLQYSPGQEWVRHLYDVIARLLPELRPQALSTVLYGLAQMGQRPEAEWLDAILPYVRARLRWFPPQSLALTIHALAVMGCRPPDSWLASFHAQLDDYRGQLDMRVRSKVREAYRLMDFRPGLAAAGANGAGAQGPLLQQERQQTEQQQVQQQTAMLAGRQGVRAKGNSRPGNNGELEAVPPWNWGHGAANDPSAQRHKQQDQEEPEKGVGEEEKEEAMHGPLVRPQLQGRRGEASGDSRQKGRESVVAATEDSVGQMLVRPSRFVF